MNAIQPLRFSTLIAVETRKLTDTRSGRWMLGVIVGLSAAALAWKVGHADIAVSSRNYIKTIAAIVAFGAPIIGLLAMTSEWTQRTALATFTMVPRRLRVVAAKFVASMMLSLGLLIVGVLLALGATALGGVIHGHAMYDASFDDLRGALMIVVLQVVMASAFGALAAQTAVALVAYLAAPAIWADFAPGLFKGAAPWFDVFGAYDRLSSNRPLDHVAQTLVSITVWVAIPAAIGVLRSIHREIK